NGEGGENGDRQHGGNGDHQHGGNGDNGDGFVDLRFPRFLRVITPRSLRLLRSPIADGGYMLSTRMIRAIGASTAIALISTSALLAESTSKFQIEEATIDTIQSAIRKGDVTSTQVVEMYLKRIKAYDGPCVAQPEGPLGPFTTMAHAGQINSLITLNLR